VSESFGLTDTSGKPLVKRDGEPFKYSSRELARLGKKYLEPLRNIVIKVVSA
jgi:hypothetical protein